MSGIHQMLLCGGLDKIKADYLLVGGGGSGGGAVTDSVGGGGAGGGGGGVSYGSVDLLLSTFYLNVVIGEGGAAVPGYTYGNAGNPSGVSGSFSAYSGGGGYGFPSTGKWGSSDGIGGAGGTPNGSPQVPRYTPGSSNGIGAGSGAGAGDDGPSFKGGDGYYWSITGQYYGGGGAGGGEYNTSASGGLGGGGYTDNYGGHDGADGYGGGGGGGITGYTADQQSSGRGGSGTFIFSYVSPKRLLTGGLLDTSGSGNTIRWTHVFLLSDVLKPYTPETIPMWITAVGGGSGGTGAHGLLLNKYKGIGGKAGSTFTGTVNVSSGRAFSIVVGAGGVGGAGGTSNPSAAGNPSYFVDNDGGLHVGAGGVAQTAIDSTTILPAENSYWTSLFGYQTAGTGNVNPNSTNNATPGNHGGGGGGGNDFTVTTTDADGNSSSVLYHGGGAAGGNGVLMVEYSASYPKIQTRAASYSLVNGNHRFIFETPGTYTFAL